MKELAQALDEMRDLHRTILRRPAPQLSPSWFATFPPGADPVQHALREVEELRKISDELAVAPRAMAWTPLADSRVTGDEFVVSIDLAGVKREDIEVVVVGRECIVRGERPRPESTGNVRQVALERPWGPFERRFVAPLGSRLDEIEAKTKDGLLELRIPVGKDEAEREQKVDVH